MQLSTLAIFVQFLRRDAYIYSKRSINYIINFALVFPMLFAFLFCYVQPALYFSSDSAEKGTTVFIGHALIVIIVLAYNLTVGFLFDLEGNRFINYQISLLPPRLVLLERILFCSLFVFVVSLPFFPIGKLLMGNHFITTHTSWPTVIAMLYLSALCCASYIQCMVCIIPNVRAVRRFWLRVNFILITLGGLFIPWFAMAQFSKPLGYIALANPLLYITEGLRSAILGSPLFIPAGLCMIVLLIFSCIFTYAAWILFKKRVDHI